MTVYRPATAQMTVYRPAKARMTFYRPATAQMTVYRPATARITVYRPATIPDRPAIDGMALSILKVSPLRGLLLHVPGMGLTSRREAISQRPTPGGLPEADSTSLTCGHGLID
eukprot:98026-Chlamydomonas_euryale.AAC.1